MQPDRSSHVHGNINCLYLLVPPIAVGVLIRTVESLALCIELEAPITCTVTLCFLLTILNVNLLYISCFNLMGNL